MPVLHVLRAFTGDDGSGGNALGVFLEGAAIGADRRQDVAADLGCSRRQASEYMHQMPSFRIGYRLMRLNLRTPCEACSNKFIVNTDLSNSVVASRKGPLFSYNPLNADNFRKCVSAVS
jgi:hypothetical protein